jgi:bifunctional non-homologous end joining protein LigD
MKPLTKYRKMRDFKKTREPAGKRSRGRARREPIFVVQEHHARRLHFDFRLEAEGVLKSWAVTSEPSTDPAVRRLAIEVEDHPIEYAKFSGTIPRGQYGAGSVEIWDRGTFETIRPVVEGMERGKIEVLLRGRRLRGVFELVRISGEGRKAAWLFFKRRPRVVGLRMKTTKRKSVI